EGFFGTMQPTWDPWTAYFRVVLTDCDKFLPRVQRLGVAAGEERHAPPRSSGLRRIMQGNYSELVFDFDFDRTHTDMNFFPGNPHFIPSRLSALNLRTRRLITIRACRAARPGRPCLWTAL
ncbi:hypothetical protein Vretimale_4689, partial [Volvox reticuliferus]